MDSKLFSRIVKELLTRDGNVVLDGFGTFYIEDVPAYFSDKGYTLNPPYRKVCFKTGDFRGDAPARLYAESNSIELPRAKRLVGEYVDTLKEDVFIHKTVVLPDLGRLRVLSKDKVFFIPDPDLAIFPEYDLLESISLKSLGNFQEKPAREQPQEEDPIREEPQEQELQEQTPLEQEPQEEPVQERTHQEQEPLEPQEPQAPRNNKPVKKRIPGWVIFIIVVISVAALLLGGLAFLGRFYPELVDPFLYNEAELDILRRL